MARRSFRSSRGRGPGFKYVRHLRSLIAALNLPSLRVVCDVGMKKYANLISAIKFPLPAFVVLPIMLWFRCVIYFWITIPYTIISLSWSFCTAVLYLVSRRSSSTKKFLLHATAIREVLWHMFTILTETSMSVLTINGIHMAYDIIISWVDDHVSTGQQQGAGVPSMTYAELNDLLYYEELSDDDDDFSQIGYLKSTGSESRLLAPSGNQASIRRRMRQQMHQYIPPHTFRAKVRVKSEASTSGSTGGELSSRERGRRSASAASSLSGSSSLASPASADRACSAAASPVPDEILLCPSENEGDDEERDRGLRHCSRDFETIEEFESPASFPCTPFSRAQVMNKNAEKVISTIFSARDVLRMELLSASNDEYSRRTAVEARTSKKMAIYDPKQTSDGLTLTCGNHCLMKAGKGLCYTSRSMLSIKEDAYVYYEFSVTASNKQVPVLALGLSTPDTALSTMAGSSRMSFGVHSDGRVLIGSKWYSVSNATPLTAGSTVGFLVYISSSDAGLAAAPRSKAGFDSPEREHASAPSHSLSFSPERGTGSKVSGLYPNRRRENLLTVNVNGTALELDERASEAVEEMLRSSGAQSIALYPTVSLMSPNVRVWCRFSDADILHRKASAIGAPDGAKVYGLDGSRV